MTYALTGASGQFGRAAAELLLERVDPASVVLVTRDPAKLADLAARGADVRAGDFAQPATLADAFAGVDRLLIVSTDVIGPQRVEGQRAAVAAATAAGVGHLLYTSIPNPDHNAAAAAPDHAATEQAIRDSGVGWTFLRNNIYADMQLGVIEQAAGSGSLVTNVGAGRFAYVTRADCAAAAVAALVSDSTANTAYDITGPDAVGAAELAAIASTVSGRPVEVVDVDDAAYIGGLVEHAGLPRPVAEMLSTFQVAAREGALGDVSTAVEDLTGHRPTALADLAAAQRG